MTGSGTQADPFIITSKADLQAIEDNLGSYYELGSDIDASGSGEGFTPISLFTGNFDGKGYVITGFFINRTGTGRQALFGYVNGATINDVDMTGVDITSDSFDVGALIGYIQAGTVTNCTTAGTVDGNLKVGGLIGYMEAGTVSDCSSSCVVTATTSSTRSWAGGLMGYMEAGDVDDCFSTGAVTGDKDYVGGFTSSLDGGTVDKCYATGAVTCGDDYAGGFVADMPGGAIDQCYATGNVTNAGGDDYSGGFVGFARAGTIDDCYATGDVIVADFGGGGFVGNNDTACTIDDCYSTGTVTGATIGGFCGNNAGAITNCFWDTETSGQATSDGGTGKTTAQMKTRSTFTDAGWDFSTIWIISGGQNDGYPYLSVAISTAAEVFEISIVQTQFHYVDAYGVERYFEGTPVV